MSLLIKGMDMPKTCQICRTARFDRIVDCEAFDLLSIAERMYKRSPKCPLIEVSTPHGRLIDADKLEVHDGWLSEAEEYSTHITFVYSNAIDLAHTVIEAEE